MSRRWWPFGRPDPEPEPGPDYTPPPMAVDAQPDTPTRDETITMAERLAEHNPHLSVRVVGSPAVAPGVAVIGAIGTGAVLYDGRRLRVHRVTLDDGHVWQVSDPCWPLTGSFLTWGEAMAEAWVTIGKYADGTILPVNVPPGGYTIRADERLAIPVPRPRGFIDFDPEKCHAVLDGDYCTLAVSEHHDDRHVTEHGVQFLYTPPEPGPTLREALQADPDPCTITNGHPGHWWNWVEGWVQDDDHDPTAIDHWCDGVRPGANLIGLLNEPEAPLPGDVRMTEPGVDGLRWYERVNVESFTHVVRDDGDWTRVVAVVCLRRPLGGRYVLRAGAHPHFLILWDDARNMDTVECPFCHHADHDHNKPAVDKRTCNHDVTSPHDTARRHGLEYPTVPPGLLDGGSHA